MFELSGPALRGKQCTPVQIEKIAIRELKPSLGVLRLLVVDAQMPFGILCKTMLLDELVLLTSRRLVITPRVSFVPHKVTFAHQLHGVVKSSFVQLYSHDSSLGSALQKLPYKKARS